MRRTLGWSSLLLALAACAGISVRTSYDPQALTKLNDYRTYAWLPEPATEVRGRIYNPIVEGAVHQAVDGMLGSRGYRLVEEAGEADFLVGWHGVIESKVDVSALDNVYGRGPWYATELGTGTYVREYEQGTLVLDFIDSQTDKLVWRGAAQAELSRNPDPQRSQEQIHGAVKKMLDQFPPTPAGP